MYVYEKGILGANWDKIFSNVLLKEVLHHVMLMVEYEFSFLGLWYFTLSTFNSYDL